MPDLISPEDLSGALGRVVVLDVRWQLGRDDGHAAYLTGHVPTAAYVDLETALADPPGVPVDERGRHPLPDPDRFAAAMQTCGVRADRPVVVYDDWSSLAAARAWWLLRHHGHRDVRVLDGGWSGWCDADRPVATGETVPESGDFVAGPGRLPVVDAAGAARAAAEGVLLDARAPERYRGDLEPVDPVAGHVPGARNAPAPTNLRDGRFRPLPELAEVYAATAGAAGVAGVAVYCGSGVTAALDVLALHLLGREAALYPGSWSGWLADPDRPVAAGDEA